MRQGEGHKHVVNGMKKTQKVGIEDVYVDERLYPRAGVDWRTVHNYKLAMLAGTRFPPIAIAEVDGSTSLVDGRHRIEAAKALGAPVVEAEHLGALSRTDALLEATKRNSTHGRPLGRRERTLLVQRLRVENVAVERIAAVMSLPVKEVVKIARRVLPGPGAGGPTTPADLRAARFLLGALRSGDYTKTPEVIGILHELRDELGRVVPAAA